MNKNMKKLFTGKFRGIPVALLTVALLLTIGAGAVLGATNGGYVLWEGQVDVQVREPITIKEGPDCGSANESLVGYRYLQIYPGGCWERAFNITSAAGHDLLVKAEIEWYYGGSWHDDLPPYVSVAWYDCGDPPEGVPPEWLVSSVNSPVMTSVAVCVDGASTLQTFGLRITFTRQSPPDNG